MNLFRCIAVRLFGVAALLLVVLAFDMGAAVAAPPTQDAQHLGYDQSAEGQLTENTSGQRWTFSAQAGDVVLIDMRAAPDSSLDTLLTLLDPDGNTIMTDDDGGEGLNSRIGPYPVTQGGVYTAIAAGYTGSGMYTITAKNLNTIPTLVSGKPLVGTVNADHPTDYFQLDVPASGMPPLMRFDIQTEEATSDPYLSIYNAAGFVAGTEQMLEQQLDVLDPVALIPGETYVAAVSWNPDGSGGDYELTMNRSDLTLLEDGVAQSGNLDYDTLSQRHYFMAQQDDTVRVTIRAEGDIGPAMTITSVMSEPYLFMNEGSTVRELSALMTVPEPGVHVIEVRDGSYQGGSGSYTLRVEWVAE